MWPLAMGRRQLAGIPAVPAALPAGKVRRRARGSPWLDLCTGLGQGGRRRARTAEQDGGGRCDLKSGGTAAFPGQCVKA
jgi:hypothetical protein